MILWASDTELMQSAKSSVTDDGLCTTINSNTMDGTFNLTKFSVLKPFVDIADEPLVTITSAKVKGSGYLYRVKFWLNVRNPNPTMSAAASGNIAGHINAAINDWNEHFSVRLHKPRPCC